MDFVPGLNLSKKQIAKELDASVEDVQKMTTQLREGVTERKSQTILREEVECDEVYITAGHKGNPKAVERKGRKFGAIAWKAPAAEARWKRRSRPFWG
jgi:hypothetical protein